MLSMAAPRRRVARAWWRAPVLRRASRRRAEVLLLVAALGAVALGSGAGLAVRTLGADDPSPGLQTVLGPVSLPLPAELGPWTTVTDAQAAELLDGATLGPVDITGVWGALAPGDLVVTVLGVAAGSHGGVDQFRASVPSAEQVEWSGRAVHAAGAQVTAGTRELVLVAEASDGDLVILSVSGPVRAFSSGALDAAFRAARVD